MLEVILDEQIWLRSVIFEVEIECSITLFSFDHTQNYGALLWVLYFKTNIKKLDITSTVKILEFLVEAMVERLMI